jgi:hypothetical protein
VIVTAAGDEALATKAGFGACRAKGKGLRARAGGQSVALAAENAHAVEPLQVNSEDAQLFLAKGARQSEGRRQLVDASGRPPLGAAPRTLTDRRCAGAGTRTASETRKHCAIWAASS